MLLVVDEGGRGWGWEGKGDWVGFLFGAGVVVWTGWRADWRLG